MEFALGMMLGLEGVLELTGWPGGGGCGMEQGAGVPLPG